MNKLKELEEERSKLIKEKPHLIEYQKKLDRLFAKAKGNTISPTAEQKTHTPTALERWVCKIGR